MFRAMLDLLLYLEAGGMNPKNFWKKQTCAHPFEESTLISKTITKRVIDKEYHYVVNVRQCAKCESYFFDNGLELKE